MSGKTILITGSTGFVGKNLVANDAENTYIPLTRAMCDLSKPISPDALPTGIDTIIHLAISRHIHEFPEYAKEIFAVNVNATLELLEHAVEQGVENFILVSTGNVSREYDPSFYTTTKQCAELIAASYRKYLNVLIIRPIYVYGVGQDSNRMIPKLIHRVLHREPIYLNGTNGVYMNPLYIDDMVECLKKSIGYKSMRNSSFTVSGNEIMSIRSISEYIGELCGVEPIFEQKHDMSENMIGDMLFQKELFTPKVSLKEGLSRVVNDVVKK